MTDIQPAPFRHPHPERILILKMGALGDIIQAAGALAAIRRHHPAARITVLTKSPFVALFNACPYIDDVIIDTRPKAWHPARWLALRATLRARQFQRVYDLQNSDRSGLYLRLLAGSGADMISAHKNATIRNTDPARTTAHVFTAYARMLALAGINDVAVDPLSWLAGAGPETYGIHGPYMLLVPGASPSRPEKRWPPAGYAALAAHIAAQNITPVIIGSRDDSEAAAHIAAHAPSAINLCGKTALADIPALARHARAAIGNDTGPMHMIGPTGCPSLVLFSAHSDPARYAPRGACVQTLREAHLPALQPQTVEAALAQLLAAADEPSSHNS